jgi:hypothetical protein
MSQYNNFYAQFLAAFSEGPVTEATQKGELLLQVDMKHFEEMAKESTQIRIYACEDERRVLYEADGVLMGYAMLYPDSIMTLVFPPISLKAKWFVLIFAGIELLTGVTGTGGGIAHFAHLGGLIFGFLLIMYWKKRRTLYSRYD